MGAFAAPIPLRVLLAAQPELVTPALQVVQRVVTLHLIEQAELKAGEGHSDAVMLIQRFGSGDNINVQRHCPVLGSVPIYLANPHTDRDEARTLRPLQSAAITYRIVFGPRASRRY